MIPKKYTPTQRLQLKKQAKELSEAFGDDLDQLTAAMHEAYIKEKRTVIFDNFMSNKRKERLEREKKLDKEKGTNTSNEGVETPISTEENGTFESTHEHK